jgi:hypothetical protein
MKKIFKITLWLVVSIIVLLIAVMAVFAYKVKNGFPVSYETESPAINFPANQGKILLFFKSTGYRPKESVEMLIQNRSCT